MDLSVYMVEVTLCLFVRASSERSASDLAHQAIVAKPEECTKAATKLAILNMEQPPDGSARIPWEGSVDAEEAK